jgi:hypothetical protein
VRRAANGTVLFPGHRGTIYQAASARFTGRSRARWKLLLPDGTELHDRLIDKIRRQDQGHAYGEERLRRAGAPAKRMGESGEAWLARALPAVGATRLRHGGCYRYAFPLGRTRAERAAVRIALPLLAYPKQLDDPAGGIAA